MKLRNRLFLALIVCSIACYANTPNDVYLKSIKEVLSSCVMDYDMNCIYPNNENIRIKGKLAVKGGYYYDSSNYRFTFLNKEWYLTADHVEKTISVTHIPSVNKKFNNVATLNMSTYLFNDKAIYDSITIKVAKETNEHVWVNVIFPNQDLLQSLQVQISKKDNKPVQYTADIKYPLDSYLYSGDDISYVQLKLKCYNINTNIPLSLFDDNRLLSRVNKTQVNLKKYNNYQHF